MRDLRQAPLHLDACNDHCAIFRRQARYRIAIVFVHLRTNSILFGRASLRWMIVGKLEGRRLPADAPHFVADAVDDRLTQIRLHRADVAWLERPEIPEDMERRFLYEIARIQA